MQSILGNTRRADILFSSSGRIDITARVAKSLNLQHGDIVDIAICDQEWYLYVKHRASVVVGRHEGMAFRSNTKGNNYRVWSKALCNAVLKECKAIDKVKLCVGEPTNFQIYGAALPIIIKYILV